MSALVIAGDTSGTITIEAPAVAGTNTITLPASTGTVLTTTSPKAGNVIQVVNATYGLGISTTSATYIDTGLTASITPSSATSKILIVVNMADVGKYGGTTTGGYGKTNIVRNSTQLIEFSKQFGYTGTTDTISVGSVSSSYLDSPATTSSTTYKIQYALIGSGTIEINASTSTSTITLMEIAG
jgi:hypothetical protein